MSKRATKKAVKARARRGLTIEPRKQPGSPPGLLQIDPRQPKPQVRVMSYGADGFSEGDVRDPKNPRAFREYLEGHAVTWVNVDGIGDAEVIRALGETFELHPLLLEDVVSLHQRPKVERYGDTIFIVLRMAETADRTTWEQLSIVLKPGCLLTFQECPGKDCLDPVRQRIRGGVGRLRTFGADYLAYAVTDAVIDHYFPVLEKIGERIEFAEEISVSSQPFVSFQYIHSLRQDLLVLRRAIWPLRDALSELMREDAFFSDETRVYLRDCYDHAKQLIDVIEVDRELLSALVENSLSANSYRANEIMRVLTVLAAVFIPLNFIAALYGMNFNAQVSPLNMPELSWYYGYPFALGLMVGTAAVLLLYFWRRGWLGNEPRAQDLGTAGTRGDSSS